MSGRDNLRRSSRESSPPPTSKHDSRLRINQDENIIITTTNDDDQLLLPITHSGTNDTTFPSSYLLSKKAKHNHNSSIHSLLSYSDVKEPDKMSVSFRKSVTYKSTKAYNIKIVTPQDEFEDTIYTISNRQGKTKEVGAKIATASKLIDMNKSTIPSILDNISFAMPMP